MDLGLHDQVAVVIGGASGIGKAIASAFVAEGSKAALVDISPGTPVAGKELGGAGWIADVTDYQALCRVSGEIRAHFGRVDHIVFAAAIGSGKFGFPFWYPFTA